MEFGDPSTAQGPDLAALERTGEAFGEPTRIRIYGLLSTASAPCSAGELAQALGLHRTVIRAHLERLVELGFLASGVRHTGRGGRPAKIYAVAPEAALPELRHRWLADAVLVLVSELTADGRVASSRVADSLEAAGQACGQGLRESLMATIVADRGPASAAAEQAEAGAARQTALRWLAAAGYEPQPGPGGAADVTLKACAFRDLKGGDRELVCAFDQGLLRGLFGLRPEDARVLVDDEDAECRLEPVPAAASEGRVAVEVGAGA